MVSEQQKINLLLPEYKIRLVAPNSTSGHCVLHYAGIVEKRKKRQFFSFFLISFLFFTIIRSLLSAFRSPFTYLNDDFTPTNEQNSRQCAISYEYISIFSSFPIILFFSSVCSALLTIIFIHLHVTKFCYLKIIIASYYLILLIAL